MSGSGEQGICCQKKSNIRRLVAIVRKGKGHETCKDNINIPRKGYKGWANEVAQQIKELAVKPDDQSSNPRTHMKTKRELTLAGNPLTFMSLRPRTPAFHTNK